MYRLDRFMRRPRLIFNSLRFVQNAKVKLYTRRRELLDFSFFVDKFFFPRRVQFPVAV